MLKGVHPVRTMACLLFLGLFASYLALAPGTTEGRGYVAEEINAGMRMLESFNAWVKGRPVPPLLWSRHGPVPVLFDLPLIKLGKLFVTPDFMISLEPVLLTAGLMTIVFLWLRKLCTPAMSLMLTLTGAFGTMLWPYAYIGLETKQSFFILLAGYMALANGRILKWPGLIFFAVVCGLAMTMKSVGFLLGPAILFLVYVQFRDDWRLRWAQALSVLLVIGGIWLVSAEGWKIFWAPRGGGATALGQWTIDTPLQYFTNMIGLFGSPQKGFFVFAPPLLVSLYAIPRAIKAHKDIVIFAGLLTISTVGFVSLLIVLADELWGPRFLHILVAPLLIVIGAGLPRFEWRRHAALVLLGVIGFGISFLGAFYYYGARGWAATAAGQNTLEWFAGDPVWNEINYDARLFSVWIKGGTDPVYWTPMHHWQWERPADAPPLKTVNLRDYADPQSFLLYYWSRPKDDLMLLIFRICLAALFVGPPLLAWVIARVFSERRA